MSFQWSLQLLSRIFDFEIDSCALDIIEEFVTDETNINDDDNEGDIDYVYWIWRQCNNDSDTTCRTLEE